MLKIRFYTILLDLARPVNNIMAGSDQYNESLPIAEPTPFPYLPERCLNIVHLIRQNPLFPRYLNKVKSTMIEVTAVHHISTNVHCSSVVVV